FIITEDGAPQTISVFEYQKLPELSPAPLPAEIPADVAPMSRLPKSQIAPETPGDIRYRDRRLLALYFDMSAMPVPDQLRALTAAQKFIRSQMTKIDLAALMTYSGGSVRVLQDFTADREALLEAIEKLVLAEGQG